MSNAFAICIYLTTCVMALHNNSVSSYFFKGCNVEWGPPEDDGGTPITHYIVEKCGGGPSSQWTPCGRANGDCFKCHVIGLTPDKEYRLQVSAVNSEGASEPIGGVDSFITENPFGTPGKLAMHFVCIEYCCVKCSNISRTKMNMSPMVMLFFINVGAPGRPEMVGGDFDHFDLRWEAPKNDGGSRVVGYQIEARLWKDSVYFLAGEVRHNLEFGEAGGIEVGQAYAVRVRAINAAGPGPWSLDSDQLVSRHKALKPKVVFTKQEKELIFKVRLHLSIPTS